VIPRIREVHIRNYKSIEQASVSLSGFTVLVGANGSGKSNFVDALAFIQECLSTSVEAAFRARGSVTRVVHQTADGFRGAVGFRLVIDLDEATSADYGFEFTADPHGSPIIGREHCRILARGEELHSFEVEAGAFTKQLPGIRPVVEPGRLMLYAASDAPEFKPVYGFLTGVRIHAIDPNQLREIRSTEPGLELERHGRNAAAVLRVLQEHFHDRHARLVRILGSVVPGVTNVVTEGFGNVELLRFSERTGPGGGTVGMDQFSASDGTLRMLGVLLAVYQPTTPTVLVVEEPEATIHPAAADVLVSVLMDAAKRSQVIVTTHSPDVLDNKEITDDMLRVVSKPGGRTIIAPISSASRAAVRLKLYSPGELLRMNELNPEIEPADLNPAPDRRGAAS